MNTERMPTYSGDDDSNPRTDIDPALAAAVEDVFNTMPDKVDFPTSETEAEAQEPTSETLTTEDKGNVYDRAARLMGRLSEGAEGRKEARAAMKTKLIGFGKSALRISAAAGVVAVGAPIVAVGGAGYLAYKGGQKGVEVAKDVASTVKNEAMYAAGEFAADARIAVDNVKESYQNTKTSVQETYRDTKESAVDYFKEKATNAMARKNARLAKIGGGFNRMTKFAGEQLTNANRGRRALGARAVSIVDRARSATAAAGNAWKTTGEEMKQY